MDGDVDHSPPGTILVVSGELTRYAAFSQSLCGVDAPEGTRVLWVPGVDVVANLNIGLGQRSGEWVWLMADDHVFSADILLRLLSRQVAAVGPLCFQRRSPYLPLVYRWNIEAESEIERYPREALPSSGLHQVAACGGAGLLLRAHIFETLTPPYFEQGKQVVDQMTDDLWFMAKLARAGIPLYVDFDTVLGHQTPAVIWPIRDRDGHWHAGIDTECQPPTSAAPQCIT